MAQSAEVALVPSMAQPAEVALVPPLALEAQALRRQRALDPQRKEPHRLRSIHLKVSQYRPDRSLFPHHQTYDPNLAWMFATVMDFLNPASPRDEQAVGRSLANPYELSMLRP